MSALGLDDDRRIDGDALAYAPRRALRPDDDSSIRPILERLSRSEGREPPGARFVRKAVVHHPLPPEAEAVARTSMPVLKRLTIAAGLVAVTAAVGVGIFLQRDAMQSVVPAFAPKADAAPDTAPALPKTVQTLTIRKHDEAAADTTVVKTSERVPQGAAETRGVAGASAEAAAPAQSSPADPAVSPLTLWAMMPADAASAWPRAAEPSVDAAPPPPRDATPAAKTPAPKAAAAPRARHATHRRRQHSRRAAAAPQQPAQETQADAAQPVKKLPLQAAIDRIFGNSGTTTPTPAQP